MAHSSHLAASFQYPGAEMVVDAERGTRSPRRGSRKLPLTARIIIISMNEKVVKYGSNHAKSKGAIHHDPAADSSALSRERHLDQIQ